MLYVDDFMYADDMAERVDDLSIELNTAIEVKRTKEHNEHGARKRERNEDERTRAVDRSIVGWLVRR